MRLEPVRRRSVSPSPTIDRAFGRILWLVVCLLVPLALVGCATGDERVGALEARAAWSVEPGQWVVGEDGTLIVVVRIFGPARSPIEKLTFRFELLDAAQQTLKEDWRTIDLADVPQGALVEKQYRIDAAGFAVEGLRVDRMLAPTAEQEARIPELRFDLP